MEVSTSEINFDRISPRKWGKIKVFAFLSEFFWKIFKISKSFFFYTVETGITRESAL